MLLKIRLCSLAFAMIALAGLSSTAHAEIKSLKADREGKLLINDEPSRIWGLRAACAATKDEYTKQLIENLAAFKDDGINTLLICYQGGPGLTQKTFSADGATFEDTAARDRVRQIIAAANQKDMIVIVSLFFPRKMGMGAQDPKLGDNPKPGDAAKLGRAAYLTACRTAAAELKDHKNVILAIADQALPTAYSTCPMKFTAADIVECLGVAASVAPDLLRGGGNSLHADNLAIAKSESATVILHAEPGVNPPNFPVKKPIIHFAYFGTNDTAGRNPQGFYPPPARQPFTDILDRYMDASTAHIIAHFPAWTEGGMELKPNRFDIGGQGTQKDPGLAWYLDALHKRTRKKPATPEAPIKPGKTIFD